MAYVDDASSAAQTWGGRAVGMGSPSQQIVANLVIFVVALVSSSVTLGATLTIAVLALFFGALGVLRLIPILDRYWPIG